MKRNHFLIGLACVVFGAGCLLLVYVHDKKMSDITHSTNIIVPVGNTEQSTSSVAMSQAATTTTPTLEPTEPVVQTTPPQITFEVVTTQAQQEQGLGGRAIIPDNYAMLFVFPMDESTGFWMKDMLTSIDMIWVSDNGTIVQILPSVSPSTYPNVFYPPVPVKYVLETRAGFAAEKIGMSVLK